MVGLHRGSFAAAGTTWPPALVALVFLPARAQAEQDIVLITGAADTRPSMTEASA